MKVKPEQERVRMLLNDTVTLLCKNGLTYTKELKVQGLLAITLDDDEIFAVHINEQFGDLLGSVGVNITTEETDVPLSPSGSDRRKRRRKRRSSSSDSSPDEPFQASRDFEGVSIAPSGDITQIKHELDDDDVMIVEGDNSDMRQDYNESDYVFSQQHSSQFDPIGSVGSGDSGMGQSGDSGIPTPPTPKKHYMSGPSTSDSQNASDASWDGSNLGQVGSEGQVQVKLESGVSWEGSQDPSHSMTSQDSALAQTDMNQQHPKPLAPLPAYPSGPPRTPSSSVTISGASSSSHRCHHCNGTFKTSLSLQNHMAALHNEGVRFRCSICGRGFFSGSHHALHMDAHAGVKSYVCEICKTGFTQKGNLRRHQIVCRQTNTSLDP